MKQKHAFRFGHCPACELRALELEDEKMSVHHKNEGCPVVGCSICAFELLEDKELLKPSGGSIYIESTKRFDPIEFELPPKEKKPKRFMWSSPRRFGDVRQQMMPIIREAMKAFSNTFKLEIDLTKEYQEKCKQYDKLKTEHDNILAQVKDFKEQLKEALENSFIFSTNGVFERVGSHKKFVPLSMHDKLLKVISDIRDANIYTISQMNKSCDKECKCCKENQVSLELINFRIKNILEVHAVDYGS